MKPTLNEPLFSRRERVWLVAGAVVLVLLAGALTLRGKVADDANTFSLQAHAISIQASRRLAEGETLITALQGFHQGGGSIFGANFPGIAERFLEAHPQARWLAYAEHVPRGGEAHFEQRLEKEGFISVRVHPLGNDGKLSSAGMRLPIYRLEPLSPHLARLLGADLNSRSEWRDAVDGAIDSGAVRAVVTRIPELGLEGLLLLRATYLGHVEPDDEVSRRQQLSGMLMLFLDVHHILADISASRPGLPVSLASFDNAAASAPQVTEWLPRHHQQFPIKIADLQIPLAISAPVTPRMGAVLIVMTLALLFCVSLLHGLRLKRLARREERQAFGKAQVAEITLHSIGEAVIRLDLEGRVRYMNPVAEAMSGIEAESARGRQLHQVLDLEADGRITAQNLDRLWNQPSGVLLHSSSGARRAVACTLSSIDDEHGRAGGHVLVIRDISREHELSRELAYQARHDPLTDLPNRREFERRLSRAIAKTRDGSTTHCLFYLDLDQFKIVNDTCGHAAGDRMLRQIAGLLATEVREGDLLARLGGDEFGVLLHDCSITRAVPIAERLCAVVSGFRFAWDDRAFELGASIGVVEIGRDAGTVDDVQRAADLACYAAKDTGRNRVHVYRLEDHVISRNHRDMQWHAEIKLALEQDRFVLHAQPIRRLRPGKGPAAMHELLLRMVDANGALVPPMAFLPAAERYGLMGALDRAVIELAFKHIARAPGGDHLFTINLSGQSLADPHLAEFILAAAQRIGVMAHRVCFEVTETSAISNLAHASVLMQGLRAEGFRFALDDFGAGLSSFGYLKQLPVDFIKIDGQFVRDVNEDPVARAMVSSIVNVARVLCIETIAEKVENERAEACMRTLGADYVQGFYIGRPRPLIVNVTSDNVTPLARIA
jgi:diguanylate cyclase (GGDEF)-like protein/PAS domain S-box-containing protein